MPAAIPVNFTAVSAFDEVDLSWNADAGAINFEVWRSDDGVTYALLDSPVAHSYVDTTGTPGHKYWYKARSYDGTFTLFCAPVYATPLAAGQTSLLALRTAARQRSDMVNSQFIPDSELTGYVNSSLQELYEKILQAYGDDYWVQAASTFTTDGTNDAYALPTDFFKLLGVDLQLSGTTGWVTIWRFNFGERNQYSLPGIQTFLGRTNVRYRLRGNNILLSPMPVSGLTFRLWYAPRFTPLVNDADSFDGINGWEEWVINDVAEKMLIKEETDASGVRALKAQQEARLVSVTQNRDAGSPATVVDVYRANDRGGSGYGPDGYGF
jgi:hypothetical protein